MTQKRKELCYRVTRNGSGIYITKWEHSLCIRDNGQHPAPWCDEQLKPHWDNLYNNNDSIHYYFGFCSLEQMRRWFYDADLNRQMRDDGVNIEIWQTDDYFIGDTQMIFRKATATLVGNDDLI